MTPSLWPKKEIYWQESGVLYISIPFTWCLPRVRHFLRQRRLFNQNVVIGGPAVELMPDYINIEGVTIGHSYPGVLQRVNPKATRTTLGCPNACDFCGIGQGKIEEGGFRELASWPDLPVICDNNLLSASDLHFDIVMDRLEKWPYPDFNQGLDASFLTLYHAERFKRLLHPKIRLACDHPSDIQIWDQALETLLRGGVKKTNISTYALVGFSQCPDEDWSMCEYLATRCGAVYPQWYHSLDALIPNIVTKKQKDLGWSNAERIKLMRRFYQAKFGGFVKREDTLGKIFL